MLSLPINPLTSQLPCYHERMSQIPAVILEAARNERRRLVAARDEAERKIAELDAYLATLGAQGSRAGPREDPNSLAGQIKGAARALIVPGVYVTTQQIFEYLIAKGVVFPKEGKSPHERITKVVSATSLYTGSKHRGWSLKGEAPAGTGASGATESGLDLI